MKRIVCLFIIVLVLSALSSAHADVFTSDNIPVGIAKCYNDIFRESELSDYEVVTGHVPNSGSRDLPEKFFEKHTSHAFLVMQKDEHNVLVILRRISVDEWVLEAVNDKVVFQGNLRPVFQDSDSSAHMWLSYPGEDGFKEVITFYQRAMNEWYLHGYAIYNTDYSFAYRFIVKAYDIFSSPGDLEGNSPLEAVLQSDGTYNLEKIENQHKFSATLSIDGTKLLDLASFYSEADFEIHSADLANLPLNVEELYEKFSPGTPYKSPFPTTLEDFYLQNPQYLEAMDYE
ncbi:MAG: hypothetical protein LBD16_09110 [Oscillospiraceae bacterium]|jgi:hypothetical protein|nr:hypothetical protein [Oscillospiraceae bacterium]